MFIGDVINAVELLTNANDEELRDQIKATIAAVIDAGGSVVDIKFATAGFDGDGVMYSAMLLIDTSSDAELDS